MAPRSRDDLRRLHFINALFAHATGQDLYLAEQIKSAISFNLSEFEAKIAIFPWAAKTYETMFNAAAATLLVKVLSGHTHGGQLAPMTFLIGLAWEHSAGLYAHGDSNIYVSRGCGFWGPPMRVGSPPEIVKLVMTA